MICGWFAHRNRCLFGEYIAFCNSYKRVGGPKKECVNSYLHIDFHLEPPHIACTLRFILALVAFVRLVQLSCTTVRGCSSSQLQSSNHWKVKGYKLAFPSLCVNNMDFAISGIFRKSCCNITECDMMVESDWLFVYRRSQKRWLTILVNFNPTVWSIRRFSDVGQSTSCKDPTQSLFSN